jgi:periplasmic protein TonB
MRKILVAVALGAATSAGAQTTAPQVAAASQGFEPQSQQAINNYKRSVAQHILQAHRHKPSSAGYRNITVVGYTIDRAGAVSESWVVRTSGDKQLDDHAVNLFRKAVPLPQPPAGVFGADTAAHLSEAFVHTTDGGYRLQTLIK